MAPEDSTEVVLARMDGRLSVVEESLRDLKLDVKGGFAALQFTRVDVYESNRASDKEAAVETRRIAEHARTVAHANSVFLITGLGLVLALIKAVAG